MGADWLDSGKGGPEGAFSTAFWEGQRSDLDSGQFWADRIKSHYGEPVERLRIALENLPLPGAFREAATATRALIRERRKREESWSDELRLLYWLAAVMSLSVPYSDALREPGFNVMETIPGEVIQGLCFSYDELGYNKLALLNRTDMKWLEESWGSPANHSTLHDIHHSVWKEYEQRLVTRRQIENDKLVADLRGLLRGEGNDG